MHYLPTHYLFTLLNHALPATAPSTFSTALLTISDSIPSLYASLAMTRIPGIFRSVEPSEGMFDTFLLGDGTPRVDILSDPQTYSVFFFLSS